MLNASLDRNTLRRQTDLEELAQRITRALPQDGAVEIQPGLHFRRGSDTTERVHGVSEPSFCVIAQGSKDIMIGEERLRYDPAHYLITTVDLPLTGQVVDASPEKPYLGFRLVLDPSTVTAVMLDLGNEGQRGNGGNVMSIDVSPLDDELLDATLRLARLVDRLEDYRALAPLVIREIIYRLLTGAQSSRMRHLATIGGQTHRMVRAAQKLAERFDKPFRAEELARELGMSVSGFHAHFKAVTAMSPLQYQKQLRLQEARRLMMSEGLDASEAGYRVGYRDASFFSREYKRQFGDPPSRDVGRLRELAASRTAP